MRNLMHKQTAKRVTGFTLIEVLIALIVFSMGILTVAGLQIISKKTNFDAVQRTTATLLAQDILARMRANNPSQWDAYFIDGLDGTTITSPPDCKAASCSAQQLARFDLFEWEQVIAGDAEEGAGGLVDPNACIRGPAGGGDGTYYVIIAWRGVNALANPTVDADIPPGSTNSPCGNGEYGTGDAERRVLMISAFLAQ